MGNSNQFFLDIIEAFLNGAIEYAIFVLPFFLLFWIILKNKLKRIRIQEAPRANKHHFVHDLKYTVSTLFIFAVMDVSLLYLKEKGYTLLYDDVNQYGWLFLIFSLVFVLFLHDTFFYWTHRAMHHPKLYHFFHRVHHESTDPSPLTSGSFHPSEAIVENALQFILPFFFPLHFGVILAWQLFDMLNNILAHLGYELYPKGWVRTPILKFKTASTHHNMHHQLFNGNYALYFTWWDKWMETEFVDYEKRHDEIFERKNSHQSSGGFFPLKIGSIREEANDAFTIEFENPPSLFTNFLAGQHITLRINIENEELFRTFSLSSIPNQDPFASLTIKRIKGGKVTNYLGKQVSAGMIVQANAPSGQFYVVPEPANKKHYVMIAGGSGITPIYSMIGSILTVEPKSNVTLLYANKTWNTILLKDKLDGLLNMFPNQFTIQHFLSEEVQLNGATEGRISKKAIEVVLSKSRLPNREYYICGPQEMTVNLTEMLLDLGVSNNLINSELFTLSKQGSSQKSEGKATVTATIFNKKYVFDTIEGSTILQSGLAQQIPLPYSCQSGLCGTCKMKCTRGKVDMRSNHALSEHEISQGYVLTCQSFSSSDQIDLQNT
ncbi:MAG: hypothetical protein EBT66_06370 [Bacteroidetes bacterium]|jgi:ferredoxin-NADP reductase/sterol desaturase/sphingolipid hydroxylase (fatty acid hydroxylase superfamily)|nr:hypothetical protein [Bacteroidota bacterium]